MASDRKGEPRGDTRVSLSPLEFEEALRDLMATGKPSEGEDSDEGEDDTESAK